MKKRIAKDIPGYEGFVKIEPIAKGWSGDKKYYVEAADGRRMFLRVSDKKEFARKKAEYEMMERVYNIGVLTPQPLRFGLCGNGKYVYSLFGWIDGKDAETAMAHMNEQERYALGTKAGELLRRIHTLPAPEGAEPGDIRFRREVTMCIDLYNEHHLQSENGKKVIQFLRDKQNVLHSRPQTFCHGDFQIENLIVTPGGDVGAIDFNCCNLGYGDPWREFIHLPCGKETPAQFLFLSGMINGYFQNSPPHDFFVMLSYYFAWDALAALCFTFIGWELHPPEDGRRHMENVLRWFDDMSNPVPSWYLKEYAP